MVKFQYEAKALDLIIIFGRIGIKSIFLPIFPIIAYIGVERYVKHIRESSLNVVGTHVLTLDWL